MREDLIKIIAELYSVLDDIRESNDDEVTSISKHISANYPTRLFKGSTRAFYSKCK